MMMTRILQAVLLETRYLQILRLVLLSFLQVPFISNLSNVLALLLVFSVTLYIFWICDLVDEVEMMFTIA